MTADLGRFEDDRGVIQDVLGQIDSVTRITTVAGAVRGNHVHHKTTQWTLVLTGSLLIANGRNKTVVGPLEIVKHDPGDAHAWEALEDTECLVFTRGPRSGENYETDTFRLKEPLLSAGASANIGKALHDGDLAAARTLYQALVDAANADEQA